MEKEATSTTTPYYCDPPRRGATARHTRWAAVGFWVGIFATEILRDTRPRWGTVGRGTLFAGMAVYGVSRLWVIRRDGRWRINFSTLVLILSIIAMVLLAITSFYEASALS